MNLVINIIFWFAITLAGICTFTTQDVSMEFLNQTISILNNVTERTGVSYAVHGLNAAEILRVFDLKQYF